MRAKFPVKDANKECQIEIKVNIENPPENSIALNLMIALIFLGKIISKDS